MFLKKSLLIAIVLVFFANYAKPCICSCCSGVSLDDSLPFDSNSNVLENKTEKEFFQEILKRAYKNNTDLTVWVDELIRLYKANPCLNLRNAISSLIPFEKANREVILDKMLDFSSRKMVENFFRKSLIKEYIEDNIESILEEVKTPFAAMVINNSFLFWIIASDNVKALSYLFDLGLDLNEKLNFMGIDEDDQEDFWVPLLMSTIFFDSENSFNLLLTKNVDLNCQNSCGDTVLMKAAEGFLNKYAKILIEKGADINFINSELEETALSNACYVDNVELIKILVEKGADLNFKDYYGESPFDDARNNGSLKTVSYFLTLDQFKDQNKKEVIFKTAISFVRNMIDNYQDVPFDLIKEVALKNLKENNIDIKELIDFIKNNDPNHYGYEKELDFLSEILIQD